MRLRREGPKKCMYCHKMAEFYVDDPTGSIAQAIWDWQHPVGRVRAIQDALPMLTAEQREILLMGTHSDCFDKADDEED